MKRYGDLYDKIFDIENLKLAHKNASKGKSFYEEVKMVNSNPSYYLGKIRLDGLNHAYKTSEYVVFEKKDSHKMRTIHKLPYYPDRIVHWAIMQVIEPIFMNTMIDSTCAALPGRGIHYALNLESRYLQDKEGTKYCFKMDIHKFFESIDQEILIKLLRKKIKDEETIDLLSEIIHSCEKGIPIGNYISQYFANYYLSFFDHWIKEVLGVKYYIRYMDDIVIFASTKEELHAIKNKIEEYLRDNLNVSIKSNWQIFPTDVRGVDFVGYRHFREFILLRKSTCKQFKDICNNVFKKGVMTKHDYSSIFSYKGWLKWCDSIRLQIKYLGKKLKDMIDNFELVNNIKYNKRRREISCYASI